MQRRQFLHAAAASLAAAPFAAPRIARAQDQRVLRFVPYADVAVVDPIWTTAYATRTHALAVFDTLYGTAADFSVHPQMVAGHAVEDDGRLWRLTLREGLRFHDGAPVLARDCVASIRRWARRDTFGQLLAAATDELSATDDRTITFRLKRPFPLLPDALGRPSSLVPVIMPERLALTDPFTQVPEVIGSGPFRFLAEERVAGARVVYARHQGYVPRPDGVSSQTAGPRIAHVDRVEFNVIPDPATAVAALQSGAVDWVEQPLIDLLPMLRRSREIAIEVKDTTGMVGNLRFNHLHPPFDKAAVRRVVMRAVSQADCMTAVAGNDASLWRERVGIFAPGTPMASDAGLPPAGARPDLAALRRELDAAGYGGERIVMLAGADVPRINAVCEVTAQVMRQLGMNIDFVATDWGTVNNRITNRRSVDEGGWSCYCVYTSGSDLAVPATYNALRAGGASAGPGWPNIPALEALRARWLEAPTLTAQQAICRDIQLLCGEEAPFVVLGQFTQPVAYRKSLTGMMDGLPVLTNLRKG
ncbi:ABC transporter substrate-binding protein [Plastoroseomonas hellenica]|uniref:ABC transporter substrate-binding protein n=1 Tax=Plastoroseomonas hellenica TaxID=2687306 RepID=UPI001BA9BE04|nr:ABC transporter substrate-binding protein [Plastoroseomonas hellenica]MBR0647080.1 ABC transporter substrate-binding protein [Plastoroseomonas hellenica]